MASKKELQKELQYQIDQILRGLKEYQDQTREVIGYLGGTDMFGYTYSPAGLRGKIKLLEDYLGITYVEKCQEKLPQYIKTPKDSSVSPSSSPKTKKSN